MKAVVSSHHNRKERFVDAALIAMVVGSVLGLILLYVRR